MGAAPGRSPGGGGARRRGAARRLRGGPASRIPLGSGVAARGVEPRGGVALRALEQGYAVSIAEVVEDLAARASGSLGGLVLSGVVDRLPLHAILLLLSEAHRVLALGAPIVVVATEPVSAGAARHVVADEILARARCTPGRGRCSWPGELRRCRAVGGRSGRGRPGGDRRHGAGLTGGHRVTLSSQWSSHLTDLPGKCGREDSNLHPQWGPGPKPGASAYSATPAASRSAGGQQVYGHVPMGARLGH